MKKALLTVRFGTSEPGADAAILSAESSLREACPDSWKSKLEREGYTVHCSMEGIGGWKEIHEIFLRHLLEVCSG